MSSKRQTARRPVDASGIPHEIPKTFDPETEIMFIRGKVVEDAENLIKVEPEWAIQMVAGAEDKAKAVETLADFCRQLVSGIEDATGKKLWVQ